MIGRYRVLDPLGQGAMGTVVRAFDPELGRVVAIKTLRPTGDTVDVEQARERRFVVEARSVARLRHPGIVTVYDVGRSSDGAYMVMECVQGLNLRQCLSAGVRFSVAGVLRLMDAVLAALEHAHAHHIVHRDIKPENILVDSLGHVKLTDFGIAKMLDLEGSHATLMDGQLIGTPRYMSPEQLRGETPDARCDVYACGVLLFELLAGHAPFGGTQVVEIVQNVLNQPVPDLTDLTPEAPEALNGILRQALDRDAAQRWPSVAALRQALDNVALRASTAPDGAAAPDPNRLTDWVRPDSRPTLESLLASVKTVDPADCVLVEDLALRRASMPGSPFDPAADTVPVASSQGTWKQDRTWPLGKRPGGPWMRLAGGWRSRGLLGALVLLGLLFWLFGRPVGLPVDQNTVPTLATGSVPEVVPPAQSLAPGEQWVAPAPEAFSLTMEREMKSPPVTSAAATTPARPVTRAISPTTGAAPPQAAALSTQPQAQEGLAQAPPLAPAGADTDQQPAQTGPRRPSEPCVGLGFFQREICLWEQCDTERYRRHAACARFR